MKAFPAFIVAACVLLAGCIPQSNLPASGASSRYDIEAYHEEVSLSADLTGLWIALHEGQLDETVDGIDYTMTGNIREIVEITRSGGVYHVRSCLLPELRHVVSESGNVVTVSYNNITVEMTRASNTAMSGRAWRSTSSSEYAGTVQMKKVAPLGDTFGLFSYLTPAGTEAVASAGCFQEASLHVVGTQLLFSKWADVELANVTEWSGGTFRQTGYLFSRGGTADPVRQLRFGEGTEASGMTLREYPQDGETVSVSIETSTPASYTAGFTLAGIVDGNVALDMDIAEPTLVLTPTDGSSASLPADTPTTSSGSFDYLSMMQWMSGFWQVGLPW